jgi:predicted alpha-1,6-mannanase (GH76 family)
VKKGNSVKKRDVRPFRDLPIIISVLVLCCAGAIAGDASTGKRAAKVQLQRAKEGVSTLQAWYDPTSGLYKTTGWWNSANAITVLVDYSRVSHSGKYKPVFSNTLTAAQAGKDGFQGFINQFYDDEGWWALAWIDAYDFTHDRRYLSQAESIFQNMATGWDDVCGGGTWWNKERHYKAAIANELFLSVAAHLANRDPGNQALYLNWANKEWTWFAQTGMINAQNLVNDGLVTSDSKPPVTTCHNNGMPTWSYNQGVVLGGLAELAKLNPDPGLPAEASKIATAAITRLVDSSGIMHDPCEPTCGTDGVQFKGIFVRNLAALYIRYPQMAYKTFIQNNADTLWDKSQGPGFQFGQVWSGPWAAANAGSQSSALDAIVAAAAVQ